MAQKERIVTVSFRIEVDDCTAEVTVAAEDAVDADQQIEALVDRVVFDLIMLNQEELDSMDDVQIGTPIIQVTMTDANDVFPDDEEA